MNELYPGHAAVLGSPRLQVVHGLVLAAALTEDYEFSPLCEAAAYFTPKAAAVGLVHQIPGQFLNRMLPVNTDGRVALDLIVTHIEGLHLPLDSVTVKVVRDVPVRAAWLRPLLAAVNDQGH